jgi:hypothetical protein
MKTWETYKAGMEGEDLLRAYLRDRLSDGVTAIYNLPVGKGDIDCLLINRFVIYALEVKHHKGEISYSDGKWRQLKKGKCIGRLNDPSRQLMRSIKRLKRHAGHLWINDIIVFTHPEVSLTVENLKHVRAVKLEDLDEELFQPTGTEEEWRGNK